MPSSASNLPPPFPCSSAPPYPPLRCRRPTPAPVLPRRQPPLRFLQLHFPLELFQLGAPILHRISFSCSCSCSSRPLRCCFLSTRWCSTHTPSHTQANTHTSLSARGHRCYRYTRPTHRPKPRVCSFSFFSVPEPPPFVLDVATGQPPQRVFRPSTVPSSSCYTYTYSQPQLHTHPDASRPASASICQLGAGHPLFSPTPTSHTHTFPHTFSSTRKKNRNRQLRQLFFFLDVFPSNHPKATRRSTLLT